jgi:hypothetical protein
MSFVQGLTHFVLQKKPRGHWFGTIRCLTASQDLYVVKPVQRNSLPLHFLRCSGAAVEVSTGSSWAASPSEVSSWAVNTCRSVASKTYEISENESTVTLVKITYWVSGLCLYFGILNNWKTQFLKLDVFPCSDDGMETPTLFGFLD